MKTTIPQLWLVALACFIYLSLPAVAHERDTLKCHFDPSAIFTYTLYPAGNGGFICGVNGNGDLEIAQKFGQAPIGDTVGTECSVPDEHQLNEVLVYFGAKKVSNPNDTVYINVYSVNPVTGSPDSLLGSSFPVQISFVDTSVSNEIFTDFLLKLPIVFTDSFFLSVVFPHGAGDTLGVISSTNGQAQGTKLCWMKNSSGTWSSLITAYALDADAVIFPIVGDATIGINEVLPFISNVNVFPNPTRENSVIEFSIIRPVQQLTIMLFDISGNVIYSLTLENISAGKHMFNIEISKLTSGSYFYSFEADRNKFNGKLEIVR